MAIGRQSPERAAELIGVWPPFQGGSLPIGGQDILINSASDGIPRAFPLGLWGGFFRV